MERTDYLLLGQSFCIYKTFSFNSSVCFPYCLVCFPYESSYCSVFSTTDINLLPSIAVLREGLEIHPSLLNEKTNPLKIKKKNG